MIKIWNFVLSVISSRCYKPVSELVIICVRCEHTQTNVRIADSKHFLERSLWNFCVSEDAIGQMVDCDPRLRHTTDMTPTACG